MPVNILMPALSPTMEKGNLAKWLKKEGDKVKPGDVIAEIETDKATMEYEAVDEGTLAKIVVPEGTPDVPVKALIAVLAEEGEDVKAAAAAAGKGTPPTAKPPPAAAKPAGATPPSPAAGADVSARAAGAPSAASKPADTPRAAPAQAPAAKRGDGEGAGIARTNRVFSSPLARRLAKEAGIDLARIQGSGPHGRVIARDVEQAKSGRGVMAPAPAAAAAAPVQAPADEKIIALFEPGSYEVVPHDNVRKVIARRLLEAKLTIPHFYLTLDCNIGKLLAAREEINAAAPKD
jgi:pyruvate dehydrogenase E2 component (dihydrolipoamide acetyltransferase)